jgi:calcineurin-like phosphoesterase family protein
MSINKVDEILLTGEEIKEIEEKAAVHSDLRQPNLINLFGKSHKTIFNLSLTHGLILIQGNQDTGFEHIRRRHEFYSRYSFWKEQIEKNDENFILDIPSKFSPKSIPILDYIKIADELYKPENLNNTKNKNPHQFDMFSGKVSYHKSDQTYHLILYKNSKIIHTLYPDKSIKKRKRVKGFHFFRGPISASNDLSNGIITIKFNYLNHQNKKKYLIVIEKNLSKRVETITVSTCDLEGLPLDKKIVLVNNKFQYYKSVGNLLRICRPQRIRKPNS